MDDLIYEKDYRQVEPTERDEWSEEVYDRVLNGGMLKAYSEAMDKIPKIIVPEDKKNYEYLWNAVMRLSSSITDVLKGS